MKKLLFLLLITVMLFNSAIASNWTLLQDFGNYNSTRGAGCFGNYYGDGCYFYSCNDTSTATTNLYYYNATTNSISYLNSTPIAMNTLPANLADQTPFVDDFNNLYFAPRTDQANLKRYNISDNTISSLHSIYTNYLNLISGNYNNTIFGYRGGVPRVYPYDIPSNVMSAYYTVDTTPSSNTSICSIDKTFYAISGTATHLLVKFNMTNATMTTVKDLGAYYGDPVIVCDRANNTLYYMLNDTLSFMYNLTSDSESNASWEAFPTTLSQGSGATLFSNGDLLVYSGYLNHTLYKTNIYGYTPPPDLPPFTPTVNYPANETTGLNRTVYLNVTPTDPDTSFLDLSFFDELSNPICINSSISNGTPVICPYTVSDFNTTYGWYASTDDGTYLNETDMYYFTTREAFPPVITVMNPVNESIQDNLSVPLIVYLEDQDTINLSYSFYNSSGSALYDDSATNATNVTYYYNVTEFNTQYCWSINASDNDFEIASGLYCFTTRNASAPHGHYVTSPINTSYLFFTNMTISYNQAISNDSLNITEYKIYIDYPNQTRIFNIANKTDNTSETWYISDLDDGAYIIEVEAIDQLNNTGSEFSDIFTLRSSYLELISYYPINESSLYSCSGQFNISLNSSSALDSVMINIDGNIFNMSCNAFDCYYNYTYSSANMSIWSVSANNTDGAEYTLENILLNVFCSSGTTSNATASGITYSTIDFGGAISDFTESILFKLLIIVLLLFVAFIVLMKFL